MGLLDTLQGSGDESNALRMGLLAAGTQLLAPRYGKQSLGYNLGTAALTGAGGYQGYIDMLKQRQMQELEKQKAQQGLDIGRQTMAGNEQSLQSGKLKLADEGRQEAVRQGLTPQQQGHLYAGDPGPTDLMQNLADPNARAYLEEEAKRKAQMGDGTGVSPYFQFLPGNDGYLVGNARTGQIAKGMVGDQRAQPGALDPDLQQLISAGKARGTEVGQAEGAQDKKVIAAPNIDFLLNQADALLPKSTGSGAGAAYDTAAGFFGKSTEGAEAGDQLNVIAGNLTLAQPRMEGPQSDADRLLYQQMAADLGNTRKPIERRQKASRTLRLLNDKYKSGAAAPNAPQPGTVEGGHRFKGGNPSDPANWEKL